ncbi:hypothetical protein Tco_0993358 [Tanacetum coccineum]|uniref:Uncharacterized protein n=1 Tax=Tanacetum coccineum TaxID=301880 RepID=A0ABQ5F577_9ASTR
MGYDGLPIQPVAPPSPDYIPGPEDPQTPPVPQDEDEPMSFRLRRANIPVDSPMLITGYVLSRILRRIRGVPRMMRQRMVRLIYPYGRGDDLADDWMLADSSRDDANDEDEDDEDEEEEEKEHLALANSAIVIPIDEPVFPPKGTEIVIPPPSTDITIRARITIRPQASISLPPEAESQGDREPVVMSSTSSAVTYTSVYTDSEPDRAFWGADDKEISEGGIPRVIVLGYDGLPIQPAHDLDYVPEPIYPEYIPLEDEHEFPVEEQPLPPVDSPTAESPRYVTELDPEADPEEYEDDETDDGPIDYPMDGGDDGDDDNGDSYRDDANDEDEDEDEEDEDEEEEHLAPADSAVVVPTDEPVSPPEGTELVIPPPSTDITIGARIFVWPQTSISLPPEAEVERLLAMTTPSPSPPISLSPPSARERLARIASTQALIDAVTATLPSPPLPPSLYIPPPADRKDDIPESEQPPRKRLCLSTLGSRYEIRESSTARPTRGQGIDYGFVSTVDAEERRHGIRNVGYGIRDTWVDPAEAALEIAPMTVEEVNTRVIELAELHEHDTQDLYTLLEDSQDSRSRISQRVDMDSQRVDLLIEDMMTLQETVWMVEEEAYPTQEAWAHSIGLSQATHQELQTYRDHVYAHETHLQEHQTQLQLQGTLIQTQHQVHKTRFQMQQAKIAAPRETDLRRQAQMVETLRVMRDMRREMGDMQIELLALRGQRRARQPAPDAKILDHQDASGDADSHVDGVNKLYGGSLPKCNIVPSSPQWLVNQRVPQVYKLGNFGRDWQCIFKEDCPKLRNKDGGSGNETRLVYAVGNAEKRGNARKT